MALTAGNLIDAAKKAAFGNRGRQKISEAMLLEELNFQDRLITQMVSQVNPSLLVTLASAVSCTDSGNQNGYTLQDGIHYRDFVHVDSSDDEYVDIMIVQRQHRESRVADPAAIIEGSGATTTLYPIDPDRDRWNGSGARTWFEPDESHQFTYSYVPSPGTLSARSDSLTSPDLARELLVTSLELKVLLSQAGRLSEAAMQAALAKRRGAMDNFRMQLYKHVHPQSQRPSGRRTQSDTAWVNDEVSG